MYLFSFLFSFLWVHSTEAMPNIGVCTEPSTGEPTLEKSDFSVLASPDEAFVFFQQIYNDPRRLKNRVYWSKDLQSYVLKKQQETYVIPSSFIKGITDQLQQALHSSFADYVFYADLGHAHLLAPEESALRKRNRNVLLTSPLTINLFHTGELYQFKENGALHGSLVQDSHWRRLYEYRNFIGFNHSKKPIQSVFAPNEPYNTVRNVKGFREVGKLYFSAQQNGCFELKTKNSLIRFDIAIGL